eukprot:scaffold1525_cov142-Cylindrotheca_fusiformis.AAC.99
MVSLPRIISILALLGIVSGFVGPTLHSTRVGKYTPKQPKPHPRSNLPVQLFSGKKLIDPHSTSLGSADLNGTSLISVIKNPEDKAVETAIRRTLGCVAAAGCFGAALFAAFDSTTAEEFFAGYLLELSLSVDNLLVFLLLFEYFKIPSKYQNRVLNYGIIGAVIMRAIMIGAGAVAIQKFHVVLLGFAGILLYSSGQVLLGDDSGEEEDLSDNLVVQAANRLIKSTSKFDGDRFFTVQNGIKLATPMFICTVAVELSDVVFAVDSIPAVFGVTENPLVVFSSNMFAILGLRSLFIVLSKAAEELEYLETAVAIILGFIGSKMIAEYFGLLIPTEISLGVVITLLACGVGLSLLKQAGEVEEG